MADRRLVAQSITRSGQVRQLVTRCGPYAAILFTWAVTFVDDDSRLDGSPGQLRGIVFARYGEVSEEDVAEMLAVMNDIDLAVWYEVVGSSGERYLYFPRFTTHQTLREDRYGPSRLPPPPGWVPEQGHPYTKNDERKAKWKPGQPLVSDLRHEKPQRDGRKTVRVTKRPVYKAGPTLWETSATTVQPERATSATAAQPERDPGAPPARPIGAPAGTEDAPRLASPPRASPRLDSSRLVTAEPPPLSESAVRSGRGTAEDVVAHPDCAECGDAWLVHASGFTRGTWRGERQAEGLNDCLRCSKSGGFCGGYVDSQARASLEGEPPIPEDDDA